MAEHMSAGDIICERAMAGEQVKREACLGERLGATGMRRGYRGQVEELGNKGQCWRCGG